MLMYVQAMRYGLGGNEEGTGEEVGEKCILRSAHRHTLASTRSWEGNVGETGAGRNGEDWLDPNTL